MEIEDSYDPVDWQQDFHADASRHKALVGGLGSGKSTSALQELKTCAFEYPGSIWVVGRKLLPSLRDSAWRDLVSILPYDAVASNNKTLMNITLKNGSEFWGRPMYDPEIFKSYQIAGFFLEEANEIDKEIYDRLKDRMRQKLPNGSRPRYQSILALNPTEEDHWIPQLFLHDPPPGHKLFQSTTFQNARNLPPEYIDELKATYSEDMLQRLLYGQFGRVHKGRPVYHMFKEAAHVRDVPFDPRLPLVRGWDFGYNHPACVWMQIRGKQVRILAEVMGKKIYLEDFVESQVLPTQKAIFGESVRCLDFCDPHGADESDKGRTSIQILNSFFIYPKYRRTYVEEGVKAVRELMNTMDPATREPNYLVHPRCRTIIEGNRGGYAREEGEEAPKKDGYYEHLMDAKRYAIVFLVAFRKQAELQAHFNNAQVYEDPHTGYRREF